MVPGLEVVALKGSAVVFRGVTDAKGRFQTGPLEPGVYTIEVRTVPNTPPTSARFFLALAGAKPLGDATFRPGVAVAMNASVRNPAGIRGQVSARGGLVYVPRVAPTVASAPAPVAPAISAPKPAASRPPAISANNSLPPLVKRPAGLEQKVVNGQRYRWVPSRAGINMGRWMPESATPASKSAPASQTPAQTRR